MIPNICWTKACMVKGRENEWRLFRLIRTDNKFMIVVNMQASYVSDCEQHNAKSRNSYNSRNLSSPYPYRHCYTQRSSFPHARLEWIHDGHISGYERNESRFAALMTSFPAYQMIESELEHRKSPNQYWFNLVLRASTEAKNPLLLSVESDDIKNIFTLMLHAFMTTQGEKKKSHFININWISVIPKRSRKCSFVEIINQGWKMNDCISKCYKTFFLHLKLYEAFFCLRRRKKISFNTFPWRWEHAWAWYMTAPKQK